MAVCTSGLISLAGLLLLTPPNCPGKVNRWLKLKRVQKVGANIAGELSIMWRGHGNGNRLVFFFGNDFFFPKM